MFFTRFLIAIAYIGISIGDPTGTIIPCKKGDDTCIRASAQIAYKKFVEGYPDFGVNSSDPLALDEIIGDLSTLKYKFTENTAVGLKRCEIGDVNLDLENLQLKFSLLCPDVILSGHYTISGQLIILPIEGEGPFTIHCKKYLLNIETELKNVQASDGHQHLSVKNFKFTANAQDSIVYDFQNLFNGQKDLAEGVLKFANENWKEVAEFVQEPVISALLKTFVKNLNKFLKLISVDELHLPS